MNFNEVISNVDDLINGYVLRDGFIFKAIDEPTNVYDAIVIRNPPEAQCPLFSRLQPTRSIEEHIAFINEHNIRKALVIANDIGFLSACQSITTLQLIALSGDEFDYSALYELPALESLELPAMPDKGITAANAPDFSKLPALRTLKVSDVNEGLSGAQNLHELSIDEVKKGHSDLTTIVSSKALTSLDISNCGITSLNGLEVAEALTSLSLDGDRKLSNVDSIESAAPTLRTLSIMGCPKITDFAFLGKLHELENLELLGNNELENLDFLGSMPKLKIFRLGMNVLDGNLTPCLNVPYVGLQKGRKHYNLKDADLPKRLG